MAMIFRQPGETGIGIKADGSVGFKNGSCCHGSKRSNDMKVNSIIFYLCAGLCSSTVIESAFSANKEIRNSKLDSYSAMIVSNYLKTKQDFATLEMVNSKFRENIDKFHYNPISITPKGLNLWPHLETLHLYTDEDIETWTKAPNDIDYLHKIEVWHRISDSVKKMERLERLVAKSANPNAKITFHNVALTNPKILGKIKDGHYIFNENVYTHEFPKNANFIITSIDYKAFERCEELKSITIPDSVTSIYRCAFAVCKGLTSITIPNSVTSIGNSAFWRCRGLKFITIPDSVQSIGFGAFAECEGLTSITIPNSVTSIGYGVFEECESLKSITIPNSVQSIGYRAFSGCKKLESITIPDSVTSICDYAFNGCAGLTSITIPDSVQSIGFGAFSECSGLTSITIPNSVTSIGNRAFAVCEGLTSITIPNSVTSIGNSALFGLY